MSSQRKNWHELARETLHNCCGKMLLIAPTPVQTAHQLPSAEPIVCEAKGKVLVSQLILTRIGPNADRLDKIVPFSLK